MPPWSFISSLGPECTVIWKLCQFCQKLILTQSLSKVSIMKIWCFHWCNARTLGVCFRCLAWPRRSGRTFRPPATGRTLVFTAGPTWLTTTSSSQSLSRAVKAEPTFSTQLSTSDAGQQRKGFYLQVRKVFKFRRHQSATLHWVWLHFFCLFLPFALPPLTAKWHHFYH